MPYLELYFAKNSPTPPSFTSLSECCLALSSRQHKAFLKYLNCPYFNTDPLLIILYDRITTAKRRKSKFIQAAKIIEKWEAKTGEKHTILQLKKKIKVLNKLVQHFLTEDHLRQHPAIFQDVLRRELLGKGATSTLRHTVEQKSTYLAEQAPGIERLLDTFLLNHRNYFDPDTNYEKNGLVLINELQGQLKELSTLLGTIYQIEKKSAERVSSNQVYQPVPYRPDTEHLLALFEQAKQLLEQTEFSRSALDQFIASFLKTEALLDRTERLLYCKTIINILSIFNTSVRHPLDQEIFYWIRKSVEWNTQPTNYVSTANYLNAMIASCGCGDFNYANWYKNKYDQLVEEKACWLGSAYYHFFQHDYPKVIRILEKHFVPTTNYNLKYTLRSHLLLYRTYLAQEIENDISGDEKFFDLEDRCQRFLNRKEANLNSAKHLAYTNFFVLSKELLTIHESQYQLDSSQEDYLERVAQLQERIATTVPIQFGSWLFALAKKLV